MTAEINKKLPSGAGHHQKKKKAIFSVYMYGVLPWLWLNSDGHNIIVYLGFKVSFLQVLQKQS